jgi:hypothetical protein
VSPACTGIDFRGDVLKPLLNPFSGEKSRRATPDYTTQILENANHRAACPTWM